ncbi:MAG: hypothetical protein ACE5K1_08175 [Acidiferrobacterales bacterium]
MNPPRMCGRPWRRDGWVLLALTLGLASAWASAHAGQTWLGGAYGRDINNFDPMGAVSVEVGMWPQSKKFGFQAYLEYADPRCNSPAWTIGGEAIWRYKKFYAGLGLALTDTRLCDIAGTKWNFTIPVGFRITDHIDVQWRHRSHGDDLGIRSDTPNSGVNLIQIRIFGYLK